MAFQDMREWLDKLEAEGELKRVKAKVDWDGEIAEISRRMLAERGPAILFENIKDHENTWCRKLFTSGLGTRGRIALMLGLPKGTPRREIVQLLRKRLKEPIKPAFVNTGPVKENIIKGEDVNLFQIPVPKWHPLDGGRYINTWCGVVTMDPDTGEHNVGLYRGMILSNNKIGVQLLPVQGWGTHYGKYQLRGKPMPVAIVYGWDPCLAFTAAMPLADITEYEAMGAIRQQPVPLVKCETNDIMVPAAAEIIVEGSISPDPNTYEIEGPFGEWTGYYGMARKRPVIKVDCITFRNDPIYRGMIEGVRAGIVNEDAMASFVIYSALMWNILEQQGIPGILDVAPGPITVVKIHKTYQGQAKHIASALWGSRLAVNTLKIIMVVEEDVDIHNLRALQLAMQNFVDPTKDLVVFPMNLGSNLDVSLSEEDKNELKYGAGLQNKLLIDATIDWTTHPIREEWDNRRIPLTCTESLPDVVELVNNRWKEYGL